jgi:hypothetical protein
MMCRVIAPFAVMFRREAASRPRLRSPIGLPSVYRRLRIARHRALRWFNEPIASVGRERRARDLAPSLWRYDFRPWPALFQAEPARPPRRARLASISARPVG